METKQKEQARFKFGDPVRLRGGALEANPWYGGKVVMVQETERTETENARVVYRVFWGSHVTVQFDTELEAAETREVKRLFVQVSQDGSKHRLVCGTVEGPWVPYRAVARLDANGEQYFAVTAYYEGVFPVGIPLLLRAA